MAAKTVTTRAGRDSAHAVKAVERAKESSTRVMSRTIAEAKTLSKSELITAFSNVKRRAK